MMRQYLLSHFIVVFFVVISMIISSCSDITNKSLEQLKENSVMLDGPGSNINNGENQPLFIINDQIVSDEFLRRLKPEHIDSISIIKEDTAIQHFGNDGKNGAIKFFGADEILSDLKPNTSTGISN